MEKLEKHLIDYKNLKIGDEVWNVQHGTCVVDNIATDSDKNDYVVIKFGGQGFFGASTFLSDGRINKEDLFPSLFKSCPYNDLKDDIKIKELNSIPEYYLKLLFEAKEKEIERLRDIIFKFLESKK